MRKWTVVVLFVAFLGWELFAAFDDSPATWPLTQVVVTYVPASLGLGGIALFAGWLVFHFVAAYRSRGTDRGEPMITRSGLRWLKADAANRAWRTVLQGMAVAVLSAAGDAVLQVLQRAVAEGATSHRFDWHQVATTAMYTAGTAALMAVVAYLHRLKVDPSPMPSAEPPAPPPSPPAPPATEPMEPEPRLFAQKVKLTPADPIRREY
jgi:cytochrome c biogenesis protein CcdA